MPVDTIRINAVAKVENSDIRHVEHNGRPHIVVPSYTLPDNVVMNGGLYPADGIKASYKSLEGTLAPIGHPTVNGVAVLAGTPEALNAHHVGVWNKNVSQIDGRVYIEKWIDVEFASKFESGQRLLDAIEKGEPIHTSTGLLCKQELAVNQAGYSWIARDMRFDHDAILFDEPGAATPADGVGLMVNSADKVVTALCPKLTTNGVLKDSYEQRREALQASLRERFESKDVYVYVRDFDDSTVVFDGTEGLRSIPYELSDYNAILGDTATPMAAKVEFIAKGAEVSTRFALQGNAVQSPPVQANQPTPEIDPMDEKQIAALVGNALGEALGPLKALVETQAATIAELKTTITANADATDKANRDVILAKSPGLSVTVNALSGEALAELAATFQDAAPIVNGRMKINSEQADSLGQFNDYEGQ